MTQAPRIFSGLWRQDPEFDLLENFIIKTDSYKVTHWAQYPKGTTKIVSYLESRGCTPKDRKGNPLYSYTTFFGLQYILQRHFCGPQITHFKIDQAKAFFKAHFGADLMNEEGWRYIADKYNGYLPIKIKAVKEGSKIPLHNALLVIENTDPKCFWLTNYAETLLSEIWYGITITTNSSHARDIIKAKHNKTCDTTFVDFSLHDFGFRGVSCYEQAMIGGMAHLLSFNGTDTMPAIAMANKAYNFNSNGLPTLKIELSADGNMNITMYGNSVVATEHSTTTSWGRWGEAACVINVLKAFPNMIKSVVGDSYDVEAFTMMLYENQEIYDLIMAQPEGAKLVLRPDSGNPVEIDCMLMKILWKGFGGHVNTKGYRVLNPKVGLIQGDGIDLQMIIDILDAFDDLKFAASNIVFGSGGGLLQRFDRDTLKFAIKCSFAVINGEDVDVQKDPKTSTSKKSKKGRLATMVDQDGNIHTKEQCTEEEAKLGLMEEVFDIGVLTRFQQFDELRELARS